ncbi:MAG: methyltransferase domain-containing protein [Phycisphaerae bacterium]|nr:methyltransferase domain-containing protein [Phycisphaerae bacterium]
MNSNLEDLKNKPIGYYENDREDMLKYIPQGIKKTLEFGCGCGGFSGLLKKKRNVEAWAVEIDKKSAREAEKKLDKVINSDALEALAQLPDNYFDAIVFFDILEHLVDPFSLLVAIKQKLTDNGIIVVSLPNIRYYRTFSKLVLHGNWDYKDHGILDKTHLRFFTYKSIINTFIGLGYEIQEIKGIHPTSSRTYKILNCLSLNAFADVRYKHFAVVAKPT